MAETNGMPIARPAEVSPMTMPMTTPSPEPMIQPEPIRTSEIERCRQRSPLAVSCHSASTIAAGEGRKTGSIRCSEIAACHTAMMPAKAIQE